MHTSRLFRLPRRAAALVAGLATTAAMAATVGPRPAVATVGTCTINFNTVTGGLFTDASKWTDPVTSAHRVPNTTDYACIPSNITGGITFSGADVTVRGLNQAGTFSILSMQNSTLTVTDTTVTTILTRGTFSGGTITGAADIEIAGDLVSWTGTTISGAGQFTINSGRTLNVDGTGATLQRSGTNNGTLRINASKALHFNSASATFTNNGTIDFTGNGATLDAAGGASGDLVNSGTVTRSAGTGTATLGVNVSGPLGNLVLAAGTGTLAVNGGGAFQGGTLAIPTGATLSFGTGYVTWSGANTINGPGTVVFQTGGSINAYGGGSLTLNAPATLKASFIGAGTLAINGTTTLNGANLQPDGGVTIGAGAVVAVSTADTTVGTTLTNNGTLNINGRALLLQANKTLYNWAVTDLRNGASIGNGDAVGTFVNNGTLRRSTGLGTATVRSRLTTSLASVSISGGTGQLSLNGGGSFSGAITVPTNATLSFGDAINTFTGVTINGGGLTIFQPNTSALRGVSLNGTNQVNTLLSLQSNLQGSGSLTLNNSTTWAAGVANGTGTITINSAKTVTVAAPGPSLQQNLTNNGTILVPSGRTFGIDAPAATLTNTTGGTIDLQGDGAGITALVGNEGLLTNRGTLTRSTGTAGGASTIGARLTNASAGHLVVTVGRIDAGPTLTNAGNIDLGLNTLAVTGTMTSQSTGNLNVSASSTAHGTVTVNGTNTLAGKLNVTLVGGYNPAINTAIQFASTTGTQTGSFQTGNYQLIDPTKGWKYLTVLNKVIARLRPASDLSATLSSPANATQTVPFAVSVGVVNNTPAIAASGAAATLTLPATVTVSGALPSGCTQVANTVRCVATTLAGGASTTWTLNLVGSTAGVRALKVVTSSNDLDVVAPNNTVINPITII